MDYYEQSGAWEPIEEAEQEIVRQCAICGKVTAGVAMDGSKRLRLPWQSHAIVCNSCGYTFCFRSNSIIHSKELKPFGFGWSKRGSCPNCGVSLKDTGAFKVIARNPEHFFSEKGRCMTCGVKSDLTDVSVWSGVLEGETQSDQNRSAAGVFLTDGLLGVIDQKARNARPQKILNKVKKDDLKICAVCAGSDAPEQSLYNSRLSKRGIEQWEVPRFSRVPFEKDQAGRWLSP